MTADAGITRRELLIMGSGALAGALLVVANPLPALAKRRAGARKGYTFLHDDNVEIHIGRAPNPKRIDLRVRVDGVEVEHHPNLHPARLRRVDSPHFTVRWIRPPGT